jgi:hypothetical protein
MREVGGAIDRIDNPSIARAPRVGTLRNPDSSSKKSQYDLRLAWLR